MLKSRKTSPQDAKQIAEWMAADPNHKGLGDGTFFIPTDSSDKSFRWWVEDEHGPVFAVIGENVLRLHIQFAPIEKHRMAKAIDEFSKTIKTGARKNGYKEIIFESVFYPLVRFLKRRGFKQSSSEYIATL